MVAWAEIRWWWSARSVRENLASTSPFMANHPSSLKGSCLAASFMPPLRPRGGLFHGVLDVDAEAAPVADAVLDDVGPVPDRHDGVLDASLGEPDQLVFAHGNAGHLDHGLGAVLRVGA